ncbi:TetR/AcrR family transcriptional regulator [Brachybacterium fresconis]|uniref:TetR/AcrR family transcriptional repressor of mexJK operon n=1 Tax=Brachybacterium fresconis TaxID=173363 RepID=A0ABS4YMY0_9MICO|nr:TetR/AcrR family transcriptional regulator [Brachybacterium fresconis]MBP2410152.1 TetR/AcrR family transcriptional repressor of mexJK operon [Brachybacterium fresconis]
MSTSKSLRQGSEQKRSAILRAARELFVTEGFDRSSVDAIAARAGVSKRTVYDYFGDKRSLLRAVLEDLGRSLLAAIRSSLRDTLAGITATDQLETALVDFSMRIATDWLDSSDYTTLRRLAHVDSDRPPRTRAPSLTDEPEEAIGEQLASLADVGLLEISDPRLAADHFIGLTFAATINRLGIANATEDDRFRPLVIEGVRAFLRAYRAG